MSIPDPKVMSRFFLWLTAVITAVGVAVVLIVGGPADVPAPAPTPAAVPVVRVDVPAVVAGLPDKPSAYDTAAGAPAAPDALPNGGVSAGPVDVAVPADIVVDGLGAGPAAFASQSPNGNRARFTAEQAVAVAIDEARTGRSGRNWTNMCEGFAGSYAWGFAYSGHYSAKTAFYSYPAASRHRVTDWNTVPAGAILYNDQGTYGHAYLSIGDGKAASTDILRQGKVDLVPIKLIADRWFGGVKPWFVDPVYFQRAGGSSGLRAPVVTPVPVQSKPSVTPVPRPVKPAVKTVSVAALRTATVRHSTYVRVPVVKRALLMPVPRSTTAGKGFQRKFAAYQYSLGFRGAAADGVPGRASLTRLGTTTGLFTVK